MPQEKRVVKAIRTDEEYQEAKLDYLREHGSPQANLGCFLLCLLVSSCLYVFGCQGWVTATCPIACPALASETWQDWASEHGASESIIEAIDKASQATDVSCECLTALCYKESRFDEDARGDWDPEVKRWRSKGMMQIQDCWADDFEDWTGQEWNPDDPHKAALCAALILNYYNWDGSREAALKALARYNGERKVNRFARAVWKLAEELAGG